MYKECKPPTLFINEEPSMKIPLENIKVLATSHQPASSWMYHQLRTICLLLGPYLQTFTLTNQAIMAGKECVPFVNRRLQAHVSLYIFIYIYIKQSRKKNNKNAIWYDISITRLHDGTLKLFFIPVILQEKLEINYSQLKDFRFMNWRYWKHIKLWFHLNHVSY